MLSHFFVMQILNILSSFAIIRAGCFTLITVLLVCILALSKHKFQNISANISFILFLRIKVSKGAKIRNQYNQVPHLTQDTNGKVTNSQ